MESTDDSHGIGLFPVVHEVLLDGKRSQITVEIGPEPTCLRVRRQHRKPFDNFIDKLVGSLDARIECDVDP